MGAPTSSVMDFLFQTIRRIGQHQIDFGEGGQDVTTVSVIDGDARFFVVGFHFAVPFIESREGLEARFTNKIMKTLEVGVLIEKFQGLIYVSQMFLG